MSLVIVRLFGIFIFLKSLEYIPLSIFEYIDDRSSILEILYFFYLCLIILIPVVLILFPRFVILGLENKVSGVGTQSDGSLQLGVGLLLLGVYFCVTAAGDLLYVHAFYTTVGGLIGGHFARNPEHVALVYSASFQFIAGGVAVVGAGRMSKFLSRIISF